MHSQLPLSGCAPWILSTGGMRFDMRVLVPNSTRFGSVHQSVRETMNTCPVARLRPCVFRLPHLASSSEPISVEMDIIDSIAARSKTIWQRYWVFLNKSGNSLGCYPESECLNQFVLSARFHGAFLYVG
jgi:hypothetical protein